MQVIKEKVGNSTILFQVIDDIDITNEEKGLVNTGVEKDIQELYKKAKIAIFDMSQDIGIQIDAIKLKDQKKSLIPSKVEIEFGIGLSTEAGIIVLNSSANASLKVKLTWDI